MGNTAEAVIITGGIVYEKGYFYAADGSNAGNHLCICNG